jgi:spermidine synthase
MSCTANPALMASLRGSHFIESACSADTVSMYSIDTCLFAGTTPFCEAVIAESPVYGKVLFIDKEIQSAESDEAIYHEHLVQPVMGATHAIPAKKVLIVGGGEGATAREVLKWSPDSVALVHWVDIDGDLVNLCRRHMAFANDEVYNDPRLTFRAEDIRTFLAATDVVYDVIILDLPDPDVDELKEISFPDSSTDYPLYGPTFWRTLRSRLNPLGALTTHAGPISPGGDPAVRRAGLTWIRHTSSDAGFPTGSSYHVTIPSFQGDWGFWMSTAPVAEAPFPSSLVVMDAETQGLAFTWPRYWNSVWLGHVGGPYSEF